MCVNVLLSPHPLSTLPSTENLVTLAKTHCPPQVFYFHQLNACTCPIPGLLFDYFYSVFKIILKVHCSKTQSSVRTHSKTQSQSKWMPDGHICDQLPSYTNQVLSYSNVCLWACACVCVREKERLCFHNGITLKPHCLNWKAILRLEYAFDLFCTIYTQKLG